MHVHAELFGAVPVGQTDELGQVEHGDVDLLVVALQGGLVQVELLEAAGAHDDQRVDLVVLQVVELAAVERQRALALADTIEVATAALHLGGVVDDAPAQCRDHLFDLLGMQRVVPLDRRLRTQEVTAVVHGDVHAPKRLDRLGSDEASAHVVRKPLREVHDLQRAVVVQILGSQPVVDGVALAPVRLEVALALLERRVAAVARSHEVVSRLLDDREVARRGGEE